MHAPSHVGTMLLLLVALAACSGDQIPPLGLSPHPPTGGNVDPLPPSPNPLPVPTPPPPDVIIGGVVATVDVGGQRVNIWATEPTSVQNLLDAANGNFQVSQIGGPIRSGPGVADHNSPWSWHLDPAMVIVDGTPQQYVWVPECYILPSAIEQNVSYAISMLKSAVFTPVTIVGVQVYR